MVEISDEQIELWVEMLDDIPYAKGIRNIREHVRSSKFPPTIADIVRHDPEQFTNQNQLQSEMNHRIALMDQWERDSSDSIPEHVRKRLELVQQRIKSGEIG
ncbi:hypothetical protein [Paenibacillus lupini]|uniref:hypothetical protein n=1 Tax=Paenibacillus lupini TaxID=1450204 RepID=UPI001FBAEDFD|nr:hypothetical protein [Paenibacillus lupini]NIK24236.1 hypothetical protein [Paenibacillus lupini]